jgi:hypothetical protein
MGPLTKLYARTVSAAVDSRNGNLWSVMDDTLDRMEDMAARLEVDWQNNPVLDVTDVNAVGVSAKLEPLGLLVEAALRRPSNSGNNDDCVDHLENILVRDSDDYTVHNYSHNLPTVNLDIGTTFDEGSNYFAYVVSPLSHHLTVWGSDLDIWRRILGAKTRILFCY